MKTLKRCLGVFLVICLLLLITGCVDVQQLRDKQAYFTDDSCQTVHFRGNDYTRYTKAVEYEIPTYGIGYITEKDLPILLMSLEGYLMEYNQNCTVIRAQYGDFAFYVRNDFMETFDSMMQNPVFTDFCYYVYDEEFNQTLKAVSADTFKMFEEIFGLPPLNPETLEPTEYICEVYRADSTLSILDKSFSLIKDYTGCYYLDTGYSVHEIPSQYNSVFAEIEKSQYYSVYDDYPEYDDDLYV